MTDPEPTQPASPLTPADLALLQNVAAGSAWLRAVACTLARRGAGFRQQQPERALAFIQALERLPFYKAGQFLFDLLEWEDFMLDGPPPPILSTTLDARSLQHLADALRNMQQAIETQAEQPAPTQPESPPGEGPAGPMEQVLQAMFQSLAQGALQAGLQAAAAGLEPPGDDNLPLLEPGFYLYQDVVLGVIVSALRAR